MANPANGARRTVKCWKNRLKDPATAGASVLLLIVLFASAVQCQVEEIDVFDVDHPPNNHPDRDFEHVPVPSSKEIITNHIVPGHREEDAVSGGHHGGTGDSHYQFGQDDHHSVVSASGSAKYTEIVGDVVLGEKVLRASESPYSLRTDLEVERRARLIIEAGVTIHFAPMVGITVRGSIVAMVSTFPVEGLILSRGTVVVVVVVVVLEAAFQPVCQCVVRWIVFICVEQCLINSSTCFREVVRVRGARALSAIRPVVSA